MTRRYLTSLTSDKPVIAIAGLSCETSTFSPSRTRLDAFKPVRGDEVFDKYPWLAPGTSLGDAADWRCAVTAYALPGGTVTRDAFETLAGEIVDRLADTVKKTTAIDGLWYDIHGAMCVEGLDDVEAELLRRIRAVVGAKVIVSASMDLHGNVSRALAHQTDLITCYRTAPHVDVRETKQRACHNLVELLQRRRQRQRLSSSPSTSVVDLPLKAWIPVPILLAGEQTSTRIEPARHIYAAVSEIVDRPDDNNKDGAVIIDAAVWVGYAWADEPRDSAVVMVTGWSRSVLAAAAERLARLFWCARADFDFVAPTFGLAECLDRALGAPQDQKPFFVSDSGDNPTAGGAGDVTWTLHRILARPEFYSSSSSSAMTEEKEGADLTKKLPKLIYASLPAAAAVHTAVAAGVGSTVSVVAGAEVDNVHAPPIALTGRVHSIKTGDAHAALEVVLQLTNTNVFVILTEKRKPYHLRRDFTDLGLEPLAADVVVVKIGYLEPELYEMAKGWVMALTPGGVDQDLKRLRHKRIMRPMWPFDTDFKTEPDLKARFIPLSYEKLDDNDQNQN